MSTLDVPAKLSLYGLVAEFATPDALLEATRRARHAGYRYIEAYTPFPVEGLAEALGFPPYVPAADRASWRHCRGSQWLFSAVLDQRHALSAECWRTPLAQLARLYSSDV